MSAPGSRPSSLPPESAKASRSVPRVAILGGSSAYLPALAAALCDLGDEIPALEVRLQGRDLERVETVAGFCGRYAERRGVRHVYCGTTARTEALRDADLVINHMRIGGFDGRTRDERVPLRHGLPGDETIGPGGLASAMRTLPVLVSAARAAREYAPGATWLHLSNPLGIGLTALARAVPDLRALGLCELPQATLEHALHLLDLPEQEVDVDYLGLNHQGWFVRLRQGTRDLLEPILAARARTGSDESRDFLRVQSDRIRALGALPLPYMRLYYHREREVKRARARSASRGEELAALARDLLEAYRTADGSRLPAAIERRSMPWYAMAVAPAIAALLRGRPRPLYVSERNDGHVPGLAPDAIVEKRALLGTAVEAFPFRGPVPAEGGPLEPFLAFLRRLIAFEQRAVEAAFERTVEAVEAALAVHPFELSTPDRRELARTLLANDPAPLECGGA